jgi:predicted RNase H-like nuclease (RuvC/YqgF family)
MPSDDAQITYCNARKKGNGDTHEKRDPGPEQAGDGYCSRMTDGGRCRMHGRNSGAPVKHGLHSALREDLREYVEHAASMDAPGDLKGELAVLRGLLYDFLDGKEQLDESGIKAAHKLLSELRKTSDTIHRQMMREAPTQKEVRRMTQQVGQILREYVPEEKREDALRELERLTEGMDSP